MNRVIITCNAGSSNTKLCVFDAKNLAQGDTIQTHSEQETIERLEHGRDMIAVIGHRVVHGGDIFFDPVVITDDVIKQLEEFTPLAPLHQPIALSLMRQLKAQYPSIPQIACFDTGFHHSMSKMEKRFALPQKYYDSGIKRYGFHGLSYHYITSILPSYMWDATSGRVIVAHLGNGASMCAIKNLKSVASTMGFSTIDGLMMGTRVGALDAGVVLHLLEHKNMSAAEIEHLLYKESGLLGVSGITSDMQQLLESPTQEAYDAVELYCYIAAKQLASLLPALGGIDALVFTGGIGENAQQVREKILGHLKWLDDFKVYIIPTNEELVIAKACKEMAF